MVNSFKNYDKDSSETINKEEFKQVLKDMGHSDVTDSYLSEVFSKIDLNKDGVISWEEFLNMMQYIILSGQKRKS